MRVALLRIAKGAAALVSSPRSLVSELIQLAGLGCFVWAGALLHEVAGVGVGGVCLLLWGYSLEKPK